MSLFRRTVDPSLLRIKLRLAKILAAAERERADEAEAELRQLSELWYGDDEAEVPEESKTAETEWKTTIVCPRPFGMTEVEPPADMMDRIWANISRKELEEKLYDSLDEIRELKDTLAQTEVARKAEAEAHRLATEKLIDDNVKTLENAVAAAEKRSYAQVTSDTDKRLHELKKRNDELTADLREKTAVITNLQQTVRNLLATPEGLRTTWIRPADEAGVGPGRS